MCPLEGVGGKIWVNFDKKGSTWFLNVSLKAFTNYVNTYGWVGGRQKPHVSTQNV